MTFQVEWREVGSGTLTGSASGIATEFYDVAGLSPSTNYEWRVRETDGAWSAWLAFTTDAPAGSVVTLPTPLGEAQAFAEIIPVTRPEIALPTPLGLPQASGEVQYITPPAFAPTDIAATEAWSLFDEAYTVTWTWEHVAGLSGVTGFAGTLSYGLVVVPFTSVGKTVAFTGVPAETLLTFEVWAVNEYGIGPSETGPFTTGGLPPALVTGIGYTATVDSLTFYWDPAARADSYEARLYRDGALVELQEPLTEDAVFTGLEDGITYEVEIRGVNETAPGLSGTRTAITQYIAPIAPTNLRQEGSHWVLAQVYWDAPISKVTFYESIVLLDGDEVFKSIVPVDPTERLFLLPKAGSTYQWKVRAGNPGGLSAFAEIDIYTRGIEIDSRLAVLPACYQEDYLFPDTWDGGTDMIADNVGDPQISRGMPAFGDQPPFIIPATNSAKMNVSPVMGNWQALDVVIIYTHPEAQRTGIEASPLMGNWTTESLAVEGIGLSDAGMDASPLMGDWTTEQKMYIYFDTDHAGMISSPSMGDWYTEE